MGARAYFDIEKLYKFVCAFLLDDAPRDGIEREVHGRRRVCDASACSLYLAGQNDWTTEGRMVCFGKGVDLGRGVLVFVSLVARQQGDSDGVLVEQICSVGSFGEHALRAHHGMGGRK